MQVAQIHECHVYWQIKISQTIFEKGQPSNISMKLFQNVTSGFRDFFNQFVHLSIEKVAPIHKSHVYWRIKILWTAFEKGHPRNIPVKLF